ncbi:hypothetical protein DMC30DRAFT_407368 [Rhodotorula diobovata]|uniref:HMG domain-containing protein n=1 Tax=Rhodotorula diobovata TaxID=5288 RepID=A0A5C5FJB3_9BASI|nr:hypothetical protein DMC30DRAFT_407534 [Rhodotorula diobovata]TNY16897.1 hypothetical protein DMC30DRAFT_407468 [Rhodotorula diobovata]TNY16913.1 hypothetical protein DMC30DRAFT_407422 [Rhodotorula diobovata]TNY16930.1 hypothetical protein DMC30DRAFT_407368 [Rhodotorula diobovata]
MEAWGKQVQLEYVACEEEGCNKGRIGPDLFESGLFNLDNVRIFARELLDDFTASATASETPFHAFWTVKKASYLNRDSIKFVDVAYFRRAWYAYARSTRLSSGMKCPKCGPCPEIVIADGHVTATRKKAATGRLDPPT